MTATGPARPAPARPTGVDPSVVAWAFCIVAALAILGAFGYGLYKQVWHADDVIVQFSTLAVVGGAVALLAGVGLLAWAVVELVLIRRRKGGASP